MNIAVSPVLDGSARLVPVLLAGGSGNHLWPLSRELHPKPFLRLAGDDSLLQQTVLRALRIGGAAAPIVIGNDAHRFLIAEHLREIGVKGTVVLEPESRNTAPAVAIAAQLAVLRHGPDALLLVMDADQAIGDEQAFAAAVITACAAASAGCFVTFGIRPAHADAGLDYMKTGLDRGDGSYEVQAFVESPSADVAEAFLRSGEHYWKSGMFLVCAGHLLQELQRLQPELYQHATDCLVAATFESDFIRLDAAVFARFAEQSIDRAILERTPRMVLVPLDAAWDDIGSWRFLETRGAADGAGNRVRGDVVAEESCGNLVMAETRLVGLLGVVDHVVVETADAILVAHKGRVRDVKKLVSRLKSTKRSEAESHRRAYRPWGFYESVAAGERFQVKRIVVAPGQKLSLQMHHHRSEHWVVVRGTACVTCGERRFLLGENESTYIPLGTVHRLENPGKLTLELVEIQSGGYLGEDDIERFEDVYGRTPAPPLVLKEKPAHVTEAG